MSCVKVKSLAGRTREICDGKVMPMFTNSPQVDDMVKKLDRELGKGPGDIIKKLAEPVAKLVGKSSCSSCEARRLVTNAISSLMGIYGTFKAGAIITELYRLSMTAPGDEVVQKLDKYLHGKTSNNTLQSAAR